MIHSAHKIVFIFSIVILTVTCHSQNGSLNHDLQENKLRPPAVAGIFYPEDSFSLTALLDDLFRLAKPDNFNNVRAIVVPHAGYKYSGTVAASGYNQVDRDQKYEHVFILASSHKSYYQGASIYLEGNYFTPLGEVRTDRQIANQLCNDSRMFSFTPEAHESEHSIEVQLPFLQHMFGHDLNIVPILIGSQSAKDCRLISEALEPYFTPENLFIVSTDFSHYPAYQDAIVWDNKTADSVLVNSPESFLAAMQDGNDDEVDNLLTRACGWTSLITLLYLSSNQPDLNYHKVIYQNSGDSDYGSRSRVVGYFSFVLTSDEPETAKKGDFDFTQLEKRQLLFIARHAISDALNDRPEDSGMDFARGNLNARYGVFVSLYVDGQLRGCIGTFETGDPLYSAVRKMAIASATKDARFIPVTSDEVEKLQIEISVLSPLKKIGSIDEVELGKHGIYIKQGTRSGTFLPRVALETRWSKEEFLGHCAQDKAGIGWEGWKNAEIFTYEAIVFSDKNTR